MFPNFLWHTHRMPKSSLNYVFTPGVTPSPGMALAPGQSGLPGQLVAVNVDSRESQIGRLSPEAFRSALVKDGERPATAAPPAEAEREEFN